MARTKTSNALANAGITKARRSMRAKGAMTPNVKWDAILSLNRPVLQPADFVCKDDTPMTKEQSDNMPSVHFDKDDMMFLLSM